jgi:hypothetical protein
LWTPSRDRPVQGAINLSQRDSCCTSQPLPPAPPPPESFSRNPFATHFNFGRFAFERVNFFNFI